MIEHRREDRAAREGELFRLLVENVLDYAIFIVDAGGIVRSWSCGAARLLGYEEAEIVGRSADIFFTPEDLRDDAPGREMREALATGRGVDDRWHVRKDGSRFWASGVMTALKDDGAEYRGFAKIMRDRTDWWHAEEARQEGESRKAAILATSLDCIISMDHKGNVVEFNPAAERTFGHSRGEVLGREMAGLIIPPQFRDAHRAGLAHLLATGEGPVLGRRFEIMGIRADGSEFPVELAITRIPGGGKPQFTAYLRDITDRRRAEGAIVEGRRLAEFGRDIGLVLTQSASLAEMLNRTAEETVRHLDGAFARIWTANEAGDELELRASAGLYTHLDGPHARVPVGRYKIGTIARERKAHLTNAVIGDPLVPAQDWAAREGMVAFAGYPLVVEGRLVGVWAMFARHPLSDATLQAMASVADGIAVGIEQRRGEARLREHREWLRVTLASIGDAVIATDTEGRVTYMNPVAEALTGWPGRDAGGRALGDVFQIVNEETRLAGECPAARALREGQVIGLANHTILIARDGTEWPIDDSASPIRDEAGRVSGVVLIFREVSERRAAEERAREQTRIAETLHRIGGLMAAELDIRKLVQVVTDETTRLIDARFGAFFYNVADDRGEAYSLFSVSGMPQEAFSRFPMPRNTALFGPTFRGEGVIRLADVTRDARYGRHAPDLGLPEGYPPVRSYLAVPVQSRSGEVIGGLFFGHPEVGVFDEGDERVVVGVASQAAITLDNARLYGELKETDRRKNEFLATLAHELRNPLAPIRNTLHLMKQADGDGPMEEERAMAERQVVHLTRLIDDLMDVARISRGKIELQKEVVDLATVVSQAVETARPQIVERRHDLSVAMPLGPIRLEADPTRLEQVLWNLLNNSAKYSPPGGKIALTVEPGAGEVVLRVRDEGIGIAPGMLPHIFDMFVQVGDHKDHAQGGLGIGLSLVRTLVEMHGGSIAAHSQGPGTGSEFVVRLPVLAPTREAGKAADRHRGGAGTGPPRRRILVVDDNIDAARSLARLLSRLYGQEVQVAHDGPEALEKAGEFRPEVVLLDIGLPGMSGYQVAERLRGRPEFESTLIVALTGWGQEDDRRRSVESGIDRHLVKPVKPEDILDLLVAGGGAEK